MTGFDQAMAGLGIVTLGASKWISNGAKVVGRLGKAVGSGLLKYSVKGSAKAIKAASNIVETAKDLGLTRRSRVADFANLSSRVSKVDTKTYGNLKKIAVSAKNISPKLGDKYVRNIPDLAGSRADEFLGAIHKGEYKPGEVLFQALRTGQTKPGRWFTPIKPINAAHAEELLNIAKYGNDAGQLKVYKVTERVSGYAGKVAGGTGSGHQFYIPKDVPLIDVIEEILF